MYARLDANNAVAELLDYTTLSGRFHPEFVAACVECEPTVQIGWIWDGTGFAVPAGPTVDEVRAAKLAEIDAALAALDASTTRPLRAILVADAAGLDRDSSDLDKLSALEASATDLRAIRAEVEGMTTVTEIAAVTAYQTE